MLVVFGLGSGTRLGVRETPDIASPTVSVSTFWPGADPAIVESDVTEILERQLNGVEGVRTLTSTSSEQSSSISIEFDLDRDLEEAANDVRARVARARRDLPQDAEEPVVEKADANAQPVMFLRLTAPGADLLAITEVGETLVRERLENVPGVSAVELFGAKRYAMRIELDPVAMSARGLTLSDVEGALWAGNVDRPAGRVEGEATQLTVQFRAGLKTVEDFEGLVLRGDPQRLVRLRDVATVRVGAENERSAARADGVPAISVAIVPQADANVVAVSDEVRRRIPGIVADLPPGMTMEAVYDRGDTVRTSLHDVEMTLILAFVLVVLVTWAFLRDVRATLVPAVAIPVSLIGTLAFMGLAGFTINVFTLFGLVLAIGIVVDDAIVVLENVVRHIDEGRTVREATLLGTREIAGAVVSTTLALAAVFVPVVFTGGTTGRLFVEFGMTVAVAVLLSGVVALTLTPMLCDRLLTERSVTDAPAPSRTGWIDAFLTRPRRVVPILVVAVLGLVLGANGLAREFFPIEDRNMFILRTVAPEGTSFAWTDARMREVEELLTPLVPERRIVLTRVAMGPGSVVSSTNHGMFMFPLVPAAERDRSQMDIVASLRPTLGQISAFRVIPIQFPTVGRGFTTPVQFVLQHPDFAALSEALPRFLAAARKLEGLTAVNEDLKLDRPELRVRVDRVRAAEMGISLRDIARSMQVLTNGVAVSTYQRGVRQYDVMLGMEPGQRDEPDDLAQIALRARNGRMIPLSNLVTFEEGAGAAARFHFDRSPSATISANLDGWTQGEAIAALRQVADEVLSPDFRTALAGESREFEDANRSLAAVFGFAILLVYLLLAVQFDSFVAPVAVLSTVPLALFGAFAGLWAMGQPLSFFAQVGLVLLIGLATKNGILIVEVARQRTLEGMDPWEAATEAAHLRFRPILMTSLATISGAIPIMMGMSGSSRTALGTVVVAGMLGATFLSVVVTPVVFAATASIRWPRWGAAAVLLLLLPFAARAEEPLTLANALEQAMSKGTALREVRLGVEGSDAGLAQVRAGLLPSGSASAGLTWSDPLDGGSVDGTWSSNASARVDVPLIDFGGIAGLRSAVRGNREVHARYEAAVEHTLADVASRYVGLQQARESVAEARTQRAAAVRLADLAGDRVMVGAAPAIDRTRAELAARRSDFAVLAAGTRAEAARLALAEALGGELTAPLVLAEAGPLVDPDAIPDNLASATTAALQLHPGLAALREQVAAVRAARSAEHLDLLPGLDGYGQVGASGGLSGPVVPSLSAGVSTSVTLFSGGSRSASLRGSRVAVEAAELALLTEERRVETALRVGLRVLRDAADGLVVADAVYALAEDEVKRAEERYRAGATSNFEVIQAQADRAGAASARIEALGGFNLAVVRWYAAQGRLREFMNGSR